MKIGILGSGDVGKALAKAFIAEGHAVIIATRDPQSEKAKTLSSELGIDVKNFAETAEFAELAVLCTKWDGTKSAIDLAKPENLTSKVLIDTTNPLDFSGGFPPSLAVGNTDSGGEQVQRWLPNSHVVKAFNIVGNQHMYKPKFGTATPTMFYCGENDEAKATVKAVLESFGWETFDIGGIDGSRELEPLCILWVKIAKNNGNGDHAFKLLQK